MALEGGAALTQTPAGVQTAKALMATGVSDALNLPSGG
jgi:hypothetical protein